MRVIGLLLGALAVCTGIYEYAMARRALKSDDSIALPQHLSAAPAWARWLNRREGSFRASLFLFIGLLVGAGSLAPSARTYNGSHASAGANAIMIIAVIALCGMFISGVGKWAAKKLRRPDSNVTAVAMRSARWFG